MSTGSKEARRNSCEGAKVFHRGVVQRYELLEPGICARVGVDTTCRRVVVDFAVLPIGVEQECVES